MPFYELEHLMDIWFLLDIIVTFNTGYCSKGQKIIRRKSIIRHYSHTWFIFDLLAALPFNYIFIKLYAQIEDIGEDPNNLNCTYICEIIWYL